MFSVTKENLAPWTDPTLEEDDFTVKNRDAGILGKRSTCKLQ